MLSTGAKKPFHPNDTVTVKLPVVVFPAPSVLAQVTVVVPGAKVLPLVGVQPTGVEPLTVSAAVATQVTGAPAADVAWTDRDEGSDSAGPVVSRTVTVKSLLRWLPEKSVAVQVTVVVPSGNIVFDAGSHTRSTLSSTASRVVTR